VESLEFKKFIEKQSQISDKELIKLATKEVRLLAKTGGKSHKMTVPPSPEDTDMIFCELIKRFKMYSEK
jgi:hypothetical protein